MRETEILLRELVDDGVLRLTMNDTKRRNALSEAMLVRLGDAFAAAASDASVRVVVLAANGPAFCAGHDLKELTAAARTAPGAERDLMIAVGRDLGRGLGTVVTLLDLRCFLIGGGFGRALDVLREGVEAGIRERCTGPGRANLRILSAELGPDATVDLVGILGYYSLISMTIKAFDVSPLDGG